MERVLIANLPPMSKEDLSDFERHGGIWGEQRAIRRKQLQFAVYGSLASGTSASIYAMLYRGNTRLVGMSMFTLASITGLVTGNYIGTILYQSVARNDETTMMRRLWWAKRCMREQDLV